MRYVDPLIRKFNSLAAKAKTKRKRASLTHQSVRLWMELKGQVREIVETINENVGHVVLETCDLDSKDFTIVRKFDNAHMDCRYNSNKQIATVTCEESHVYIRMTQEVRGGELYFLLPDGNGQTNRWETGDVAYRLVSMLLDS